VPPQTVGVTPGTVYGWIRNGRIPGQQRAKGLPWQITLADEDINSLRQYVQRVRRIQRSRMEAA
jgi:predicted site-specific integrase-resolvase